MAVTTGPHHDAGTERTEMALARTMMANARTLMAWGRTGLSQISLGLALYKFIEAMHLTSGRRLALIVMSIGTTSSFLGIADYLATSRRLRLTYRYEVTAPHFHLALAAMIAVFGLVSLVTLFVGIDV